MSEIQTEKRKVKFLTLGCRLNQYETQAMREKMNLGGYEEAAQDEIADVFVINTCTVTSDADRESRYLIRKCHRENPNAKVVVTGCYAEKDYKKIQEIEGVSHILLNRQKSEIAHLLDSCTKLTFESDDYQLRSKAEFVPLEISDFSGKARANIKVQDGCNHACSFCKVVLVRGKSRSREQESIVREAKRLSEKGFLEIVLTGVQLGAYGLDFETRSHLCDLIRALIPVDGIKRIRLSSIEPTDVTDELIDLIATFPKLCPHLHIPLQSGSSSVLKAMNRRYSGSFYPELISKIRAKVKNFILTTDVMVGFPGESESDFRQTHETLLAAQAFKMHIFPYSAREGTRAFSLPLLDSKIIRERMNRLMALEEELRDWVQREYIGKGLSVLIEDEHADENWVLGRASNYLPVRIMKNLLSGSEKMIDVKIEAKENDYLYGSPYNHGASDGHH